MNWVATIIVAQIVFAMILSAIMYLIWKIAHPGQKW